MTATPHTTLPRRIVVTGATGKLGRAVVTHLRDLGVDVLAVDRAGGPDPRDVEGEFMLVDLTDYGQVADALGGVHGEQPPVEAVVHLAAIPAPGLAPDAVTFANNVPATFNVLHAAIRQGIRTIVTASSETVLGLPFDTPPPYVPVDEEYPARPESVYSLGKHLEEAMAIELCRWHPDLTISALRFFASTRIATRITAPLSSGSANEPSLSFVITRRTDSSALSCTWRM